MLKTLNQKISIVLILLSAGYLYMSYNLKEYSYVPVDSDFLPKVLGYLLIVLAVFLFFDKSSETEEEKEKRQVPRSEILVLLAVGGMIFLYIFLLEIIGFVLSSVLFVFCCSLFLGYRKHKINAMVAVIFPLVMYLSFNYLLQISLPQGILPF
ncbi:tripartite tricarboxylate transporter TctB family protein [Halobacillus sp. H74]|uniref:tripartite tricarboxylate transporter TctB family protein n=1 Tax=Halobacillus sp. H74 TaxID=3457436 RepID=UPI003FCCBF50